MCNTYSERAKAFGALGVCPLAHLPLNPTQQVPEGFRTGDDVEWCRQRGPFFKVTHPQLGPGELPLNVGVILKSTSGHIYKARAVAPCYLSSVWSVLTAIC